MILFILAPSLSLEAQTISSYINEQYNNYYSKEEINDIVGSGEYDEDGMPDGFWTYHLKTDVNRKYYEGRYDHGRREGVWKNYSITLPANYANNEGLIRLWEVWKEGKLYQWKGGANFIVINFENGVDEEMAAELRRLDEAFEFMYRSTKGDNYNDIRSESLPSLAKRLFERIKDVYMDTDAAGNITFYSETKKEELYEEFNNGKLTKGTYCDFEGGICYSKQVYLNDTLREKYLYMLGEPSDVDIYTYYSNGFLKEVNRYRGDSVKFGRWMGYYPDGGKKYLGSYIHGEKSGKWKYWDEEGNKSSVTYIEGEASE